jgi:hypothetical protein
MKDQEQIDYADVIALGFTEEPCEDGVYFNIYGFKWCIITLELTEVIYLDWAKETRLCKMVRLDNNIDNNVVKEMPIKNLEHLKEMIDFFSDKKQYKYDSMTSAC